MRDNEQRTGGRRRAARRAAITVLVLAAVGYAADGRGVTADAASRGAGAGRDTLISTGARPSHDELYRGAVVSTSDGIGLRRPSDWVVQVAGRDGTPVEGAAIRAALWHVDEQSAPQRIEVTTVDAAGHYHLAGVHLDRGGWWNVKLSITAAQGTDSLAFNVIIDE
jgi:hypothetical protein